VNQEIPSDVAAPQQPQAGTSGTSGRSATVTEAAPAPRRGRPRDPLLDDRALQTTLDVFGDKGWAGLTYDEVAARAKVGKSSLYLRWPTKERLLADALRRTQQQSAPQQVSGDAHAGAGAGADSASGPGTSSGPPDVSTAGAAAASTTVADVSLRSYLVDHAMRRAELYVGEHGLAMLRLYVEARALPEVFAEIQKEAITSFVLAQRHRVEEAIAKGDLSEGASVVQLLDAIEGAVLMHVLVTPPELTARMRQTLPEYVETLVDTQLRAAAGPGSGAPGPASAG